MTGSTDTQIKIRVGTQNNPDEPIKWTPEHRYYINTDDKIDIFATGKYLSFSFASGSVQPWTLSGFDVELKLRGNW
jgi:hypothetical protein